MMTDQSYLGQYQDPEQLRQMNHSQLQMLCGEIRQKIIQVVAENGGHLSANLGVVEATVALHRTYGAQDRIVWDVGHQCYAHKILTGRKDAFSTLRKAGGISGFPRRRESAWDVTDGGHSSTSISTALGLARARDLLGECYHVVAFIGDGSFTGGMAWEAMNDAGQHKDRLVVVLNDNEMSITRNVGAFADHLAKLRSRPWYHRFKSWVHEHIEPVPVVGKPVYHLLSRTRDLTKYFIMSRQGGVLFEEMGWTYMGPVDGHNVQRLCDVLEEAKAMNGPVLVHIRTQKGRGYPPAESAPDLFHGVGRFDPETGMMPDKKQELSEILGQELIACAREDHRVCAVTAAMPDGCNLKDYSVLFPERFFDVGIAEPHAMTMASGLALGGMKPVVFLYATFAQRAYDQLMEDVCLQNLPVVICMPNTGLCGNDGTTHQGVYALQYLSGMPNLTVLFAGGRRDVHDMLRFALCHSGPTVICFAKYSHFDTDEPFTMRWRQVSRGRSNRALLCIGSMMDVAEKFADTVDLYQATCIKPLDEETLSAMLGQYDKLYVLEDMVPSGSLGYAVTAFAQRMHSDCMIECLQLPDTFVHHGTVKEQRAAFGLDEESLRKRICGE